MTESRSFISFGISLRKEFQFTKWSEWRDYHNARWTGYLAPTSAPDDQAPQISDVPVAGTQLEAARPGSTRAKEEPAGDPKVNPSFPVLTSRDGRPMKPLKRLDLW